MSAYVPTAWDKVFLKGYHRVFALIYGVIYFAALLYLVVWKPLQHIYGVLFG